MTMQIHRYLSDKEVKEMQILDSESPYCYHLDDLSFSIYCYEKAVLVAIGGQAGFVLKREIAKYIWPDNQEKENVP